VVYTGDIAIKQSGSSGAPIIYDGADRLGNAPAEMDLRPLTTAFYSNPAHNFITIKGFRIYHAKNNRQSAESAEQPGRTDQLVSYAGDWDI